MPAHVKRNKSRSGKSTVGYKTINYTLVESIFRYLVQLCGLHFICVVGLTSGVTLTVAVKSGIAPACGCVAMIEFVY